MWGGDAAFNTAGVCGGVAGATTHYTTLPGPAGTPAISLRRQNREGTALHTGKPDELGLLFTAKAREGYRGRAWKPVVGELSS